jgi:abortive infection bacteriophage resistance protein
LWQQSRDELAKEYARSRETFAEHYRSQYPQLTSPPLWVACELMTLGHLSRWLQNLRIPKDRQTIADAYPDFNHPTKNPLIINRLARTGSKYSASLPKP